MKLNLILSTLTLLGICVILYLLRRPRDPEVILAPAMISFEETDIDPADIEDSYRFRNLPDISPDILH